MEAKKKNHKHNQKGIFIVLFVIMLPTLILMLALVIDLGFLYIATRQAQNLSDTVAISSSTLLLKDPGVAKNSPEYVKSVTNQGWMSVKPAARAIAQQVKVIGIPTPSANDFFDDGSPTFNDPVNFTTDRMIVSSPSGGKLDIKVRRGVRCFDNTLVERTLDLEPYANEYWCLSNTANIEVVPSGMSVFFSKFMGVSSLNTFQRTALAHVRPATNSCGRPSCVEYQPYLEVQGTELKVVATPDCPTFGPSPTPTTIVFVDTPTPTATPTLTPTPTATAIQTETPTNTPTSIVIIATNTPTPIPPTSTPTNTPTSLPPTNTPTITPSPTPTDTPDGLPTRGGVGQGDI